MNGSKESSGASANYEYVSFLSQNVSKIRKLIRPPFAWLQFISQFHKAIALCKALFPQSIVLVLANSNAGEFFDKIEKSGF